MTTHLAKIMLSTWLYSILNCHDKDGNADARFLLELHGAARNRSYLPYYANLCENLTDCTAMTEELKSGAPTHVTKRSPDDARAEQRI